MNSPAAIKFTLLTHSKELSKPSNTGKLVVEILGSSAEQLRWERLTPPAELLKEIAAGGVALLYPGPSDEPAGDLTGISHVILIDGTWHEARRIHQRSPYLQNVRRICLKPAEKSVYNLRKNQKVSGLCTAECVIEILRSSGNSGAAERLQERFLAFIRPVGARRGEKKGSMGALCSAEAADQPEAGHPCQDCSGQGTGLEGDRQGGEGSEELRPE